MKHIKENKFINVLYMFRSYFDIGFNVISYITGKLPMIASIIIIANNFSFKIEGYTLLVWLALALIIAFGIGYVYSKTGLYDVEWEKMTKLNPVNNEIYQAAKKINRGYYGKR